MRVLALETSCDETSAAVVRRDGARVTLESLTILSQDIHRIFGGELVRINSEYRNIFFHCHFFLPLPLVRATFWPALPDARET